LLLRVGSNHCALCRNCNYTYGWCTVNFIKNTHKWNT
jgi:hypothetical protein